MSIGNWVQIDGRTWNVRVMQITENFNILYTENTGRTMAQGAPMTLDPLGTFFGHQVTFARYKNDVGEYDELYNFLSTPRYKGISVKLVHNQTTIEYLAYVSNGTRKIKRIDDTNGVVLWEGFQVNFVPVKAQVIPE